MAFGTVSADVIQSSVANTSLGAGNASLMKSRIINGSMVIDQRNAGASVTPSNTQYTLDRWQSNNTQASKFTVQQNAGSVTPPIGFSNYLGITSSSAYSVVTGDVFVMRQAIEGFNTADLGWGTANAKTVTLSFQVYSSLTGTFGGSLQNSANNRSYPFTYTISSANTWTSISVTIAGDTTGTWIGATNGIGIWLNVGFGCGATYSGTAGAWAGADYRSATGATSVVGTNGATFYITGVQLEVGSSATGFEYRQYQQELALCQRYCYVQSAAGSNCRLFGFNYTTVTSLNSVTYPVTMRTSPTATISTASAFTLYQNGTTAAISAMSLDGVSIYNANYAVSSSGLTQGGGSALAFNTAGNQITLSAEL